MYASLKIVVLALYDAPVRDHALTQGISMFMSMFSVSLKAESNLPRDLSTPDIECAR